MDNLGIVSFMTVIFLFALFIGAVLWAKYDVVCKREMACMVAARVVYVKETK